MDSKIIREKFFNFFKDKKHAIVPSAPIVVKNDPTLMFTNAGMNQFKDYFLGNRAAESKRVADTQKCLRVSGKHNDLEEVGHDTYHHTMFEMLGNWSFGDYFKKEAIAWAWELLTEVYQLPKDRLYASVFGGDKGDQLAVDEEAFGYWSEIIPEDRILHGSKKDNFWEMGDTGPCGPCSEIHIDLRPVADRKKLDGKELVNQDHPLVVEIWNLVFMEYNRKEDGSLVNLPETHIDTGMGFERLCMAVQGKTSNYDTDVFTPLIEAIANLSGLKYGEDEKKDIAFRVISDHIRAVSFAIADGQLPSNTGAGYVIRRILRRAVRYGFTFLNFSKPTLFQLVDVLVHQFEGVFDELKAQQEMVSKVIEEEENSFLHTLENGLKKMEVIDQELQTSGKRHIDGKVAFELYDTYGFPFDLTSLIAREKGLTVDEAGFNEAMTVQRERSRKGAVRGAGDWIILKETGDSDFRGYDELNSKSHITRYRKLSEKGREMYQLVLDVTPFYAESGGQVGDTGILISGNQKINVFDTQKENDLIVHFTKELPRDVEGELACEVHGRKRKLTMSNHSATHLLHAALREVLGMHVEQRGSLVNEKMLRFDFSHFSKVTDEELDRIEQRVNEKIRENIPLTEKRDVPIDEAKKMGAMALFGEKYGEKVRMIIFDQQYSVELCGGTHVPATGVIGSFKITSESSIAAGIRRIEAVTALGAEEYINGRLKTLEQINALLKHPKDLVKAVESSLELRNKLEKELEKAQNREAVQVKQQLIGQARKVNGKTFIFGKVDLPHADALKKISYELKNQIDDLVLVLAANVNDKPQIAVMIADSVVEMGFNAGNIVRELAKEIKGGGGGQPFFATAGGNEISGLDNVLIKAEEIFN